MKGGYYYEPYQEALEESDIWSNNVYFNIRLRELISRG